MKKLLMISTDRKIFEEGSVVRARQAEYAKEWGEVHIIIFEEANKQRSKETVIAPNCWAYSTSSGSRWKYAFDAIRLGSFIISKRGITDITCQDPFLTAMAGVSLKKQYPQVHLEIQIHTDIGSPNYSYSFSNKVRKFLAMNYIPRADHLRVVSNKIKLFLTEKFGIVESKIEVRPILVDTQRIQSTPIIEHADLHKKYPQFEKIVLVASRLEPEKNVALAIHTWAEVVTKMPKAGLVIVGAGSQLAELEELTSRLNLKAQVIFENWVETETLISYYKTADLFLNTSLFEGYGMTLVEAQAAGCKIVSTDVGVAREVGARIIDWKAESVANGVIESLK